MHRGTADNTINDDWIGTNDTYITTDASCTTTGGNSLHQNVAHLCGNTAGFHWIPSTSVQKERHSDGEIGNTEFFQLWVRGSTNCTSTITSLHQAAGITTAGIYCFDIGGTTFSSYVDANGYVQVAFDYGNGVGNLPQTSVLSNSARGILSTTALAALTETQEVRISSSTGNFDVTSTNSTIISRVQSNTTLHRGTADNTINDDWIGTNDTYITTDASCTTTDGNSLHQNVAHLCGNTAGFHWIPSSVQRERYSDGEIGNTEFFQLWVKGDVALPIELLNFNLILLKNQTIQLNWQTATETNNDYFTIEKSAEGTLWEEVARINGAGNSSTVLSYDFVDDRPYSGRSYYRLKQTDFDGQFSHSSAKSVLIEDGEAQIYPNPTSDKITILSESLRLGQIRMFSLRGNRVDDLVDVVRDGSYLTVDMSRLPAGLYIVEVGGRKFSVLRQ